MPVNCMFACQCLYLQQTSLTWVFVNSLLHRVVLLMDPLAVALEVNLCGRCCFAVQIDGLVLDNVALLWFKQEVRQWLRRVRRKGFRELAQTQEVVIISHWKERKNGQSVFRQVFFTLNQPLLYRPSQRTNKDSGSAWNGLGILSFNHLLLFCDSHQWTVPCSIFPRTEHVCETVSLDH